TYRRQSRRNWTSPSILLAATLLFAACETTSPRPPAPISTGTARPAPGTVPIEQAEDLFAEEGIEGAESALDEIDRGYTPPHMTGRDIKRAAVLLPFSHPRANVRAEAESMLAGIELAMFNRGEETFLILPKDTAGKRSTAEARALEALEEGVDIIIGPLFSANVQTVRNSAAAAGVPVVAFSNVRAAAGDGAYLISVAPEEEVSRIVEVASERGIESYAFLGPDSAYGRRIEEALRLEAFTAGARMISSAFYDPANDAPVDEARQVATAVKFEAELNPGKVAVLIPEGGVKLRGVAPLLPYYEVDTRQILMLGTSLWNDDSVWREPTLIGGLFPAPDPETVSRFEDEFERIYSRRPTNLASIGYDAGALASALASVDALSVEGVTQTDGFFGVNGLFRFRDDGIAERNLAVLEISTEDGAIVVSPASEKFDDPIIVDPTG
ncbi:MAG: penicillin-binding protein activator, partial [Pseudomonadota bacterium]